MGFGLDFRSIFINFRIILASLFELEFRSDLFLIFDWILDPWILKMYGFPKEKQYFLKNLIFTLRSILASIFGPFWLHFSINFPDFSQLFRHRFLH